MSEPLGIPISPTRRERLNRLEALHARGFWPFARTLCLWFYLPLTLLAVCLTWGWNYVYDIEYTAREFAVAVLETALLFCVWTLLAWRFTPWLVRTGRNNPDYTPRQWEALAITLVGLLLVLVPWAYPGFPSREDRPASGTAMTVVVYVWIVGAVTLGWGWLRWLRARKEDPFWSRRGWFEHFCWWPFHPACLLIAALMGLLLATNLAHQLGQLDAFVLFVRKFIPF